MKKNKDKTMGKRLSEESKVKKEKVERTE